MSRVPTPPRPLRRPHRTGVATTAALALAVAGLGAVATTATAATGTTTLVSTASDGSPAGGISYTPTISDDGRWIAFGTTSSSLLPPEAEGKRQLVVADVETGEIRLASAAADGSPANSGIGDITAISGDGGTVVFNSAATNLVAGVTTYGTYVVDLDDPQPQYIGVGGDPTISDDGQRIAFSTGSPRMGYVHDRSTGETTRVGVSSSGALADDHVDGAQISGGGRYVFFSSRASNLVPHDDPTALHVYRHDLVTGQTVLADPALEGSDAPGAPVNNGVQFSASDDGRYLAYTSWAADRVVGDTNGTADVFVHDLDTGTTVLASAGRNGAVADGLSTAASISDDGSGVFFVSTATNLAPVPGDPGQRRLYHHDLVRGWTTWQDVAVAPGARDGFSFLRSSGDGSAVTYQQIDQAPSAPGYHIYRYRPDAPDRVAPTATLTTTPPSSTSDPTPTFEFTSDDAAAVFDCSATGPAGPWAACTSPHTTAPLVDGPQVFAVRAVDVHGNRSEPDTITFTVDTAGPATTITGTPPASGEVPDVTFAFGSEPGATFSCALTPGTGAVAAPCTSPTTYTGLPAGEHQFSVHATDAAGNDGPVSTYTFTVTEPEEPPTLPAPSRPDLVATSDTGLSSTDDSTADTTPTLTGTAQPGTTVTVLVDGTARGSAVVPATGANAGRYTVTTTALAVGTRVVTAVASDPGTGATSPAGEALAVQVVAATACHTATNTITGTAASNTLDGGRLADRILGLGGNDTVNGRAANDCVVGGTGNDTLAGAVGNDELHGDDGDDRLTLGGGADTAYAGAGTDRVFARDGVRDVVDCGTGTDTATVDAVDVVTGCERVIVR